LDQLEDFQFDQTQRLISVETFAPGPRKIVVVSFEGTEALSNLSSFRLEVVSQGRPLKPSEILGQPLGIALRVRDNVRMFHGVVRHFEMLRTSIRGHFLHVVELTPPAWLLTLNQKFNIFHEAKATEVIEKVLSAAGLAYQPKSTGSERKYWAQYGESDFAFVSRLWEEEGLFYRFDHATSKCELIVGDGSSDYETTDPETLVTEENLLSWQPEYKVGSSSYQHGWWDFEKVNVVDASVNGLAKAQPPGLSERPVHEYPGRHQVEDEAKELATRRMEAEEASLVKVRGSCIDCRIATGVKYKVENHTIDLPGSGTSGGFVATHVEHRARDYSLMPFDGDTDYTNEFVCIPDDFNYRPPRATPRPRICGPQTATVTDTPDEYGRAKVKFHWDDSDTSYWARSRRTGRTTRWACSSFLASTVKSWSNSWAEILTTRSSSAQSTTATTSRPSTFPATRPKAA
jgi:type VI secretion system secreted protein VgrG